MNAADLMMRNPVFVVADTAVADAATLMATNHLGSLPVIDDGRMLHGEVTASALIHRVAGQLEERREPNWMGTWLWPGGVAPDFALLHGKTVNKVMSRANEVAPTASLEYLVHQMNRSGAEQLYVAADGRLVGVVNRSDILRILADRCRGIENGTWSDLEVRDEG